MNTIRVSGNVHRSPSSFSQPTDSYGWLLAALILSIVSFYLFRTTSDGKLYDLGGVPILTAWTFFSKRYDFIRRNLKRSGGLPFRFRVLQHRVVVVTGPSARKYFFNDAGLNLVEGYKILMGGAPRIEDVDVEVDTSAAAENMNDFIKRISLLFRKERIAEVLPLFIEDIHRLMSEWGTRTDGMINPFKEVYNLVFQLTVRMATCRELSQDRVATEKMARLYWELEKSATPTALLLPWVPSPSKKKGKAATVALHNHLDKYVQNRRAAGATTSDPIDLLIQLGDPNHIIIHTVLSIVFAGVLNTGVNSCWALLHLGLNPTWRQRAISELQSVLSRFCDPSSTEPLHKKLAMIPASAWEQDLPSLDLVIRETIRVSLGGTFLRRSVATDIEVQGVKVQKGDFLAYSATDAHMNEDIYKDPKTFDPARFEVGREEDKKGNFGFLGWGAGRHPCAGMKIAKLEIKIIVAMVLFGYQYDLVDENGVKTDYLPKPDWNDIHQARPEGKPVYMKFRPATV